MFDFLSNVVGVSLILLWVAIALLYAADGVFSITAFVGLAVVVAVMVI